MSHIESNELTHLREKVQEIADDELFEDIPFIMLAFDWNTQQLSLMGNACPICIKEALDNLIKQNKLGHIHAK